MQRESVRAQYICLAMDEYGDSFLYKNFRQYHQVV